MRKSEFFSKRLKKDPSQPKMPNEAQAQQNLFGGSQKNWMPQQQPGLRPLQ